MNITRRSLVTGAAGLAAATQFARPAWAPPASHGIWACKFNNTLLQNNGPIPNAPGSASGATLSILWRSSQALASGVTAVIIQNTPTGNPPTNWLNFSFVGAGGTSGRIQGLVSGAQGTSLYCISPIISVFDNAYHWAAMSLDGASNTGAFIYDGTPMTPTMQVNGTSSANWAVQLLVGGAGISSKHVISPYVGDMADLAAYATGSLIDVTEPNINITWWDSTNEEAVKNASRGAYIRALGLWPVVWLSGPPPMFKKNMVDYPFTWDPNAHPFTVAAGTLAQSTLDPWGFTGES